MVAGLTGILLALVSVAVADFERKSPNIIFVLTDNQDVEMGGMEPMRKTRYSVAQKGG